MRQLLIKTLSMTFIVLTLQQVGLTLCSLRQNVWALQAPDFSISAGKTSKTIEITAVPPSGTHINLQAPMSLLPQGTTEKIQPDSTQDRQVVFSVPRQAPQPYEISLFLCDDQNTYCEKHKVSFTPGLFEQLPLVSAQAKTKKRTKK